MGAREQAAGVLARRLPQGLTDEYGEAPHDWADLGSTRRLAGHLADALADAGLLPEGETREEWGVRLPNGYDALLPDEKTARRYAEARGYPLVRRTRTTRTHPDVVTEWQEAPDA